MGAEFCFKIIVLQMNDGNGCTSMIVYFDVTEIHTSNGSNGKFNVAYVCL